MISDNNHIKKRKISGLRQYFREYCTSTSIHGFQYFGQERTILEKLWWVVVFIATISSCAFMIYLIYQKWLQSPVIVSFATKETPIYRVPFPAITICPTSKVSHECLNFTKVALKIRHEENITDEEQALYDQISLLCDESLMDETIDYDYEEFFTINLEGNLTFSEEIFKTFSRCMANFMVVRGTWMNDLLDFEKTTTLINTDEGLCYTFNMLPRKQIYRKGVYYFVSENDIEEDKVIVEWTPQSGYSKNASLKTYPRRAMLSGATNSLELMIASIASDEDLRCKNAEQGYKVVLHLPSRLPRPREEYFLAPFNQASILAITPRIVTTSKRIKQYNPFERNCYFPDERYLKFFKSYSKMNCELECLTNYTLYACGCVEHYMPRDVSTPICGVGSLTCKNKAQSQYKLAKILSKIKEDRKKNPRQSTAKSKKIKTPADFNENLTVCKCLPPCSDVTYDANLTPLPWKWQKHLGAYGVDQKLTGNEVLTYLSIYLKTTDMVTTQRNELYGPTDFLSNFGGLLGLFSGFSILSLMEIIYFCTVRILGNISLYGKWYGKPR